MIKYLATHEDLQLLNKIALVEYIQEENIKETNNQSYKQKVEKIEIEPELDNTEITLDGGVFWKKDEQNSMCQFIARMQTEKRYSKVCENLPETLPENTTFVIKRPKTIISPGGFQKKLATYGSNNGDTYYLYKITENTIQYLLGKQVRKARYHKEEYLYLSDNGQYEPVTSDLLVRNRHSDPKFRIQNPKILDKVYIF